MVIEKDLVYDHTLFEPHTSFVIRSPVVMLCPRINTKRLEPQATWRRRRVIVFGLAQSTSQYFAIFREKQTFPTRGNACRGEHVQEVDHLLKGNQHLFSPDKVVIAF